MLFTSFRCTLLVAVLCIGKAQAGIVLNTTRVIYPATDKEVSLGVHNSGGGEILLQSWLEPAEATPPVSTGQVREAVLPFVVTPALARMHGGARQLLRIIHDGTGMPADRESVLWLNVQEIPQSAAPNSLQIAIRQRIKVFFRPRELPGDPALAARDLQWQWLPGGELQVENPGAYHVSMLKVTVQQGGKTLTELDRQMLAPRQQLRVALPGSAGGSPLTVSFLSINDFGGQETWRASLASGQRVQAERSEALTGSRSAGLH